VAYLRFSVSSGGVRPVSVAFAGEKYLYVLNAGDSVTPSSVVGYRVSRKQGLTAIEGSLRLLSSAAAGPAKLAFSPDNRWLAVTEKATNSITTFAFDETTGLLSIAATVPANGQTPFGFAWADRDTIVISEAFGGTDSAVSEYDIDAVGGLNVISGSVDAGDERAACWVAISDGGRFVYTTNTATNSISAYRRDRQGGLTLLKDRALETNPGPIDFGIAGRVGVVLNNSGSIQSFRFDKNTGMLRLVDSESGLPTGTNGLAILSER
jgi:6-phosphogluconolactonase (cycloisomerase 2 family)